MTYFRKGYKIINNQNNFLLKRKKNLKTKYVSQSFYRKSVGLSFSHKIYKYNTIIFKDTYLQIPLLYFESLKLIRNNMFSLNTNVSNIFKKNYKIDLNISKSKNVLDSFYTTLSNQKYLHNLVALDYMGINECLIPFEYFIHQQNYYSFIQVTRLTDRKYLTRFTTNNITSIKSNFNTPSIFYQSFSKSQNMILLFNKYTTHCNLTSKLLVLVPGLFHKFISTPTSYNKNIFILKLYYHKIILKFFKKFSKLINRYKKYTSRLYLKPYNINKFRIEKLLTYKHTKFSKKNRINQLGYSISKSPHLPSNIYQPNTTYLNVLFYQSRLDKCVDSSFFTKQLNLFLLNPFLLKFLILQGPNLSLFGEYLQLTSSKPNGIFKRSNILPSKAFSMKISKKIINTAVNNRFMINLIPWYHNTLTRFIENFIGKKVIIQFYPYMEREVSVDFRIRYKLWLPRMAYYERKLGHRFFLEESVHILHLGFYLHDVKIIISWLKSMIKRISFWKTRSIFRYLKYVLNVYYCHTFENLDVKGIKFRLKGKISAAGNSRKRTILYRVGKTSHSEVRLRVLHETTTINTFTGVMGLQIWLFY